MKYLTFLLFLLGGFLNHVEGQTIQDYGTYVSSLMNSGDPNQILEGQRVQNYSTGLYPSTYFSEKGINTVGAKRSKNSFLILGLWILQVMMMQLCKMLK